MRLLAVVNRPSLHLGVCAALLGCLALSACGPVKPNAPVAKVVAPKPVPATPAPTSAPDQAALVREVAAATGKDPAALNVLLDSAVVKQSIIDAMERPAEKKPWSAYRPIFMTPERVAAGIAFYRQHAALLTAVSRRYGVPPEFIVAIIGVETNYGSNTGGYRVLDALVTLAFHYPKRAQYFSGELATLLELPDNKLPGPIADIRGSYAGAQGLAQFMPSSIRDYGVDGDGDGHINLLASLPDAFASIANYFQQHGWQKGGPVAVQVERGSNAPSPPAYAGTVPTLPASHFIDAGYTSAVAVALSQPADLLQLDGANGPEYWLTFNNFHVIMRYNKSPMYALAVTQLAEAIASGAHAIAARR